ncbi:hypothetical protein Actkin_04162 [Actinokineospora sp. UTMC 2448]|nr:hypothetical protein Actkin_04162 [Actinokineospora sp. UTMC 2448]
MPTLRRGMRVQRQGVNAQCSVGPFLTGADGIYFLTVQHGLNHPARTRVVEASLNGFDYTPIGAYITGVQDEAVDWAIVKVDPGITIDRAVPVGETARKFPSTAKDAKLTGVAYNYQQGGYALFESTEFAQRDLDGPVENSPTVRKQFVCRNTGGHLADVGDSGSAVYDQLGALVGMEWAVERDDSQGLRLFYVQPILTVAVSLIGRLWELETHHADSADWTAARPLAQHLGADPARVRDRDALVRYTLSLFS